MSVIEYAVKRRDEAVEVHDMRYWAAYLDGAKAMEREFKKAHMTPCDLCAFSPPSSLGEKPCHVCPAERKKGAE